MAIVVSHLVSGEQVVSKVEELRSDDGPQCFEFTMPLLIIYKDTDKLTDVAVEFRQWQLCSKSIKFRINFEQVITMGEPDDHIKDNYLRIVQPLYPVLNQEEFEKYQLDFKERQSKKED